MHKNYLRFILLTALIIPGLTFGSTIIKNACNKRDSAAVREAIIHYLDKNPGLHSKEVIIIKTRCLGRFASAIIHPKKPVTDDATVYLHKKKQWKVLSIGTDFDKDLLKKIPKGIRTY